MVSGFGECSAASTMRPTRNPTPAPTASGRVGSKMQSVLRQPYQSRPAIAPAPATAPMSGIGIGVWLIAAVAFWAPARYVRSFASTDRNRESHRNGGRHGSSGESCSGCGDDCAAPELGTETNRATRSSRIRACIRTTAKGEAAQQNQAQAPRAWRGVWEEKMPGQAHALPNARPSVAAALC